jgi:serine/threonine protein kinase
MEQFFKSLKKFNNINDEQLSSKEYVAEGGFGIVYKCKLKNFVVANKIIRNTLGLINNHKNFINELQILKKISHELVPCFYGIYHNYELNSEYKDLENKTNLEVGILTEFIDGNSFNDVIYNSNTGKLMIVAYLIDLAAIVEYCHSVKIIHKDLKPDNVMISKKLQVKLLDYGISKDSERTITATSLACGTPRYIPPEIYKVLDNDNDDGVMISNKWDVWSFGCIISEALTKSKPWGNISDYNVTKKLIQEENFPIDENITDIKLGMIIEKCTKIDPKERFSMTEVKSKLIEFLYEYLGSNQRKIKDLIPSNLSSKESTKIYLYLRILFAYKN